MHLSKVPLVICALALGTTLTIRAEDTPAQASARAALASKLFEISAENPPITNAPPAPTVKPPPVAPDVEVAAPATKPASIPEGTMMKPADEPVMVPVTGGDAKAMAKAEKDAKAAQLKAQKEAAKMAAQQKADDEAAAKIKAKADADKAAADLKAQKIAAKKAADKKAADIAAAKKQVKANMDQSKTAVQTAPVTDTPSQTQAKQAMANSLFQESSPAPTAPAPSEVQANKPAPVITTVTPTPTPMPVVPVKVGQSIYPSLPSAPPLPISSDKQQKLQELLTKYRADQVTPDEYQKQRAAILAEP